MPLTSRPDLASDQVLLLLQADVAAGLEEDDLGVELLPQGHDHLAVLLRELRFDLGLGLDLALGWLQHCGLSFWDEAIHVFLVFPRLVRGQSFGFQRSNDALSWDVADSCGFEAALEVFNLH